MARSEPARRTLIAIAGGDTDPNLQSLLKELRRLRYPCLPMLVGTTSHPRFTWDLQKNEVRFQSKRVRPTALFIRHDVFTNLNDGRPASAWRAYAWFTAVASWAAANPDIKVLNRHHSAQLLKPQQLTAARSCGLEIPKTLITNDLDVLARLDVAQSVVKPVAGGDYCRDLSSVLRKTERQGRAAAAPAIVQELLVPPELRIYRVGKQFLSYNIASDALDYRTTPNCTVTATRNDPTLIRPLRRLMDELRLDFGAADFKTCPDTGKYLFLEVNSSPMFAAFDAVSNMGVSRAIGEFLR